jgi:hypothetical protein
MLKTPETFPDIDLTTPSLEIPEDSQPELLGGGFNSSAWIVGSRVLKITSQAIDKAAAITLLDAMQREHATKEPYIGANMPDTGYSIAKDKSSDGFRVAAVQPFIEGTPPRDFFAEPDANVEPFIDFLERSRECYRQTGLMPDVGCIENHFFWPLVDTNTLIQEARNDRPMLVDTTSGKTQRHDVAGKLWNKLIYVRAGHAINNLSWRLYESSPEIHENVQPATSSK